MYRNVQEQKRELHFVIVFVNKVNNNGFIQDKHDYPRAKAVQCLIPSL